MATVESRDSEPACSRLLFTLREAFSEPVFWDFVQKLRLACGFLALLVCRRDEREGESFESWLVRHGQGGIRAIKLFWEPVLVSALNERIGQMDVGYARKVFLDGFLRSRDGFQLEIPIVPLGELYGTRLENWLAKQGVTVRLKTGIEKIECDEEGSVCGVSLRTGQLLEADMIVLAVPFDKVLRLVPAALRKKIPDLERLDNLRLQHSLWGCIFGSTNRFARSITW